MNEPITAEIVESQALAVRPISGLPTVQDLEQQFALAIRQRELLSEYIKKQLVPGKHFYQRGTQKPSLAKEGAEIILLPHNLAPDYEQTGGPDAPPADGKPYQITVKCTLRRKGDPTSFVGSGIGSAGSEKWSKECGYVQRQVDKYLCHNATLKMAQKSAMIAATINSTAASEFFTQDIEEAEKPEHSQVPVTPTPQPTVEPKPAVTSTRFPTGAFRLTMINQLKANPGAPNRQIVTEYFRKVGPPYQLMPNEELEDLPLRFVPATKEEMLALHSKITGFAAGDRAEPAFPAHQEPDKPKVKEAVTAIVQKAKGEEFWDIIITMPRKGMKKAEYLKNPDTIRKLFDLRHGNDDEAQSARQRLWGLCEHFEAKPWTGQNGKEYPPTDADVKCYQALQEFKIWFAINHPDEKL